MQRLGNKRFPMYKCRESARDVRSRYVSSSAPCGSWVALKDGISLRVRKVGKPDLPHENLAEILEMSSSISGLESVVRQALPRWMDVVPNQHGAGPQHSFRRPVVRVVKHLGTSVAPERMAFKTSSSKFDTPPECQYNFLPDPIPLQPHKSVR